MLVDISPSVETIQNSPDSSGIVFGDGKCEEGKTIRTNSRTECSYEAPDLSLLYNFKRLISILKRREIFFDRQVLSMKTLFPKNIPNRKERAMQKRRFIIIRWAVLTMLCIFCTMPSVYGQVSGEVYKDYNSDGKRDTYEHGVANMTVTAVDSNGNSNSDQTDADGAYSIDIADCSGMVRLFFDIDSYNQNNENQFEKIYSGLAQKIAEGTGNGSKTNVAFVECTATGIDLGVLTPIDYCEANPPVVVPCYVGGDPLADCAGIPDEVCSGTSDVLVAFNYDNSGLATPDELTHLAVNSQVGSVWGVAYDRVERQLYSSSVLRPHVGFGELGTGGIYKVNLENGIDNAAPESWLDLDNICGSQINTGLDPHIILDADKSIPAHDTVAIIEAGKMGLGGLAISDDGSKLWTVNLLEKTLHSIDLTGGVVSCDHVRSYEIPDLCDNADDMRPWAVSIYHGQVFVGTVCSNESGDGDFFASVHQFDPIETTWNSVLTVPLDYVKGGTQTNLQKQWNAWTDFPEAVLQSIIYPQPILADLVFDGDGSMVIGMMDRTALQAGYQNYFYPNDNSLYDGYSGGDILRAQWNGTIWILENNASFPSLPDVATGCGVDNGQGIGGGEFYCGDDWELGSHQETCLGGLAILLGSGDVMSATYDPIDVFFSGGVQKYSNLDGSNILFGDDANSDDYAIYAEEVDSLGIFGKTLGIGDVELLCGAAPFEIGNQVWFDANENGLQDGGETGIEGVEVQLVGADGIVAETVTTGPDGSYYFNNVIHDLLPNTAYTLQILETQFIQGSSLFGFNLTDIVANQPNFNSEGSVDGNGRIRLDIQTGTFGETTHTYDFGFKAGEEEVDVDLSLTKTVANALVEEGGTVTYILTVENESTVEATNVQVADTLVSALTLVEASSVSGTYENNVWTIPSVPGGTIISLSITATVGALGSITNTAEIIAQDQTDIDSTPNNNAETEDDYDAAEITGIEPSDCEAEAGMLAGETAVTILPTATNEAPLIDGAQTGEGYFYAYVLVGDLDETDGVSYDIISTNSLGVFDFSNLTVPDGLYYVQAISLEGTSDELAALGLQSTDQLLDLIVGGLCADVLTPGYAITVEEDCLVEAGSITAPANTTVVSGGVSEAPTLTGEYEGEGYAYAYVLTTDIVAGDDIQFNIIDVNDIGIFDFTALGLEDGTYTVHGLSYNESIGDLTVLQSGEEVLEAIADGLCADLLVSAYNLIVGEEVTPNECQAETGTVTSPANTAYTINQTTDPAVVTGQNTETGYIHFFILTDDLVADDGVQYNFIEFSQTGEFDIAGLGLMPGNYEIIVVSYEGGFADFQGLGLLSGEDLEAQIAEGLCADIILPAYNIDVIPDVEPCEANAGVVIPPSITTYTAGQQTEVPTVTGQTADEAYEYYFVLTTDLPATVEVFDILDINTTGVFDLSSYGLTTGTFAIHGLSIEAGMIGDLNISTGDALLDLILNNEVCADLLVPGYTVALVSEDCLAAAGTVTPPEETTIFVSQSLVPFNVTGNYSEDGYIYVALLSENNNILAFNQSGGFNFAALGLDEGTYEVYGVSILGDIESFPDYNFNNITEIVAAIDTGLCADITIPGFTVIVEPNPDCIAESGIVTAPTDAVVQIGGVADAPSVEGNVVSPGYSYLYVLTTDFTEGDGIEFNIIDVSETGAFNVGDLNLAAGSYTVFGISYEGSMDAFENAGFMSVEALITEILNEELCADVVEDGYSLVIEEECDGIQTACAPTSLISQVPTVLCPEFCNIGNEYMIIDVQSSFNCSVHLSDDSLCVEYLPLPGFPDGQTDSVTIVACIDEGELVCDTAIFYLNIGCHEPLAVDDVYTAFSGVELDLGILLNDSDPCDKPIEIEQVLSPENAIVVVNDDGTLGFTADEDYTGTIVFPYQICNDCGACMEATVIVTVEESVEIDAVADVSVTAVDVPISINVLANDIGVEIMITGFTEPTNGSVQFVDGELVYTPNAGFMGVDFFTYTITDLFGQTAEALVTITVGESTENQEPIALDDDFTTIGNEPITVDVVSNDVDPDGDELTVTEILNPPTSGTVVINDDGTITYTPDSDAEPGEYEFEYVVCDDGEPPLCDTALVVIMVEPSNENMPPVAVNDQFDTTGDEPVTVDVTANDIDPDGDELTVTEILNPPTSGTVVINDDGTITYTPDPNAEPGEYDFEYVVCDDGEPPLCDTAIVVIAVDTEISNTAPIAVDDAVDIEVDEQIIIDILANDSDAEGDNLTVTIVTNPANGVAIVNADGTVTYSPNPGFEGTDVFEYEICDDGIPSLCDIAEVTVTIGEPTELSANPDIAYTTEGTFINIDVLSNDTGNGLMITETTEPENGALVILPSGEIQYIPNDGFIGTDYFFYTVCDVNGDCVTAAVSITVLPADAPNQNPTLGNDQAVTTVVDPVIIDVLANDSDPNNNPLTVTEILNPPTAGIVVINEDGTITYTPDPDADPGEYTFDYVACDDQDPPLCDTAMVVVAVGVSLSNNPPIAVDDFATTDMSTSIVIDVLANDFEPDGEELIVKFGSEPANGTVEIDGGGLVLYSPENGFSGTDYFLYIICDNGNPALADTALVTVTVMGIPLEGLLNAEPDIVQTPINTSVNVDVLSNDLWEGAVSIKEYTQPANGIIAGQPDAENPTSFTYIPTLDFTGQDYFVYWITDASGNCDSTLVSINVFNSPNMPPLAGNDQATTDVNTPIIITVLGNDSDPENGPLTVTDVINGPANGVVEVNDDGTINYIPDAGFIGEDAFDYIVCDEEVPPLCDTATVVIAVGTDLTNDPPVAVDDSYGMDPNNVLFFELLANGDFDPNGDNIIITENTFPIDGEGMLTIFNNQGSGQYIPPDDFEGTVNFLYVLCDDGIPVLCDTAIVTIQVGDPEPMDTMIIDGPPIEAQVDVAFTPVNQPIDINIISNDIGEGIEVTEYDEPSNGTLVDLGNSVFQYIPNLDFEGVDYFFYTICDTLGQCDSTIVSITVFSGANLPPRTNNDCVEMEENEIIDIAVLINDIDPENDTLIILEILQSAEGAFPVLNLDGTTINYAAPADYVGIDVFEYIVYDGFPPGGLADTGTVVIKIGGVEAPNHPPKAQNLCDTLAATPAFIDLSTLVSDIDTAQNFTYEISSQAAQGQIISLQDSLAIISPLEGFLGTDYFTYVVCDDGLPSLCDTAYVKFVIPNPSLATDSIIANNDTTSTLLGEPVDINVLVNDIPSDTTGTITVIDGPSNGTIEQFDLGLFTYTPNEGFEAEDSFTYTLCVGTTCDTATVTIFVGGCNLDIKIGMSPNFDGINDYFNIPNLDQCYGDQDPIMTIYNRWGNVVYKKIQYTGFDDLTSWDGTWQFNGQNVPDGTYYYILQLDKDPSASRRWSGFIEVLR